MRMRKFMTEISLSVKNSQEDSFQIKSGHVQLSSERVLIWDDSGPEHYENILENNNITTLEEIYINWYKPWILAKMTLRNALRYP